MPQAPLSVVLKGPGEVVHAASAEAKRFVPVSSGDAVKTSHKQPTRPLPLREEANTPQRTPTNQALAGVAQGDAAVPANAASRPGTVGGAPEPARDGVEADALNRYRLALGAEARKARRYPEVSRTRGQEGTAEVYVVLSRAGGSASVIAGKSSGSPTLDEGALVMVRMAAERTPVPPELQGRNLKIPLRIRFSLDDF
jgi:protein TonB